jgi:hypothetical protein
MLSNVLREEMMRVGCANNREKVIAQPLKVLGLAQRVLQELKLDLMQLERICLAVFKGFREDRRVWRVAYQWYVTQACKRDWTITSEIGKIE